MSNLNTVQKFALAATYIAPENVRKTTVHDHDGLVALATSIRHFGRLLEPLKGYVDADGKVAIWDGGRRYAALCLIADDGDGVGRVITDAVDVYVTTQDEASAASLATFVREDMHPADQFLAYNAKFDAGMSPDQIAAAFAVESKTVSQLLRFRTLAPEVMTAFRDGQFGLDVAFAFTLTTDHDQQRAVLETAEGLGASGRAISARFVRDALSQGSVRAHDKWAQFVGREAYAEAGGTFLSDLFSDREADEQWSNGELVRSLAQQKLNALELELQTEGWGKVIVSQDSYGWANGYARLKAAGPAKKGQPRAFSADQMATGVAFIVCGYNGVEVERGWHKPGKSATSSDALLPAAKADPERFGWGHKGHQILTTVATEATRCALAANAQAGFDAAVGQIAWAVLRNPKYGGVAGVLAASLIPEYRARQKLPVVVAGRAEFDSTILHWADQLPDEMLPFMDAVAALTTEQKMELLAATFAATLDADQPKIGDGEAAHRWTHLGWMARHAQVDFGTAWVPDREFVSGGSKEALHAVNKSHGNRAWPESAKKAELVAVVSDIASNKGWRPTLLSDLMTPPALSDDA
jgi:ParB family transcriptional regulator, chromosome partitioning protein